MTSNAPDPAALVASIDARAQRFETPCGEGALVWRRWGEGPPLILLHGAQGAWSHWIRNIEALADAYSVWAVDLPGSGDSADPPEPTHAVIADLLAGGLRSLLAPHLPLDVVGFSFGGVCAAHLAAYHPDLVRRLILVDTGGLDTPMGEFEMIRIRGLEGEARTAAIRTNLLTLMLHAPRSADDLAMHLQTANVPRGRLIPADLVLPRRLQDILPRVKAQVGVIWGEYDTPHPDPERQMAAVRRDHPQAELRVIPDAGHWSMYEQPIDFDLALRQLLARPLGPAAA